ncbi:MULTISPECIES: nucleotidyltransferase domain-containing protein [unclassified Nocardia]|uniref:nucleotidyltransferase domain-containing protein n=1 Tax=unclassified Nocardia TaxID=2637762 RepID=UPI001CE46417|nr:MULTISPECIES: hypothetical protein [unclassified Nocardia]
MDDDLPAGGRRIDLAECERRWKAWTPAQVAAKLAGVSVPWCVTAGWALDLFAGEQTRDHGDIEITVPRAAFGEVVAALPEYEWDVVGAGTVWPYADAADHPELHQTWLRDPATGEYHLDVFREPHDGDRWICRRDNTITLPYAELIETGPAGIPYVIPEVALLFKARARRPKDDGDFARILPLLNDYRAARLSEWLTRLYPGHAWLPALARRTP